MVLQRAISLGRALDLFAPLPMLLKKESSTGIGADIAEDSGQIRCHDNAIKFFRISTVYFIRRTIGHRLACTISRIGPKQHDESDQHRERSIATSNMHASRPQGE